MVSLPASERLNVVVVAAAAVVEEKEVDTVEDAKVALRILWNVARA